MKNMFTLFLLTACSLPGLAQRISKDNQYRYDRLMKSAQRKQKAGFIFLGIGAAVTGGGILLIADGVKRHDRQINSGSSYDFTDGEAEQVVGALVTVLGVASMSASIPFFVGAHRSRRKAMSISLKTETIPLQYKAAFTKQLYPALAIQVPLGK